MFETVIIVERVDLRGLCSASLTPETTESDGVEHTGRFLEVGFPSWKK
jgi:hypothetical protein